MKKRLWCVMLLMCIGIRFTLLTKQRERVRATAAARTRRKGQPCSEQERLCRRYERIMKDRMHLYYSPYFSKVANPWNDYWGWPYYGMAQGNYGGNAGVAFGNGGMSFFGSNY